MRQILRSLPPAALLLCLAAACHGAGDPPERAAWMRTAKWGVMGYFVADIRSELDHVPMNAERWNYLVDHFDVEALATQLKSAGAGYHMITLGQASGYYLAPNATYDRLVGLQPSKCSRRDLVADLAAALSQRGIRSLINLTARAPARDRAAADALQWRVGPYRNREFQLKWESVIQDWSRRWGSKVAGWWFESCNWPNSMYRFPEAPNFESFAAAARAGNPTAIVAFNPGVFHRAMSMTPFEDFVAGEILKPELWTAPNAIDGKMDGAQLHVTIDMGESHGKGEPRFSAAEAATFSRKVAKAGGVITWELPLQGDGTISASFMERLKAVGLALSTAN